MVFVNGKLMDPKNYKLSLDPFFVWFQSNILDHDEVMLSLDGCCFFDVPFSSPRQECCRQNCCSNCPGV